MEQALIRRNPPPGAEECWVLDHYAVPGGMTELAERFTDAKYRHPVGGAQLGAYLTASVRECAPANSLLRRADSVVALPSSKLLTGMLASKLAKELGLPPPVDGTLSWNRSVASMKNVPVADRIEHLRGAMTATTVAGGTVVLIDDVMQTLATFGEAARAVRAAGADRIVCIALVVIDTQ